MDELNGAAVCPPAVWVRFTTASGRILIFTSRVPFLCIVIRERPTTAGKGEKSGHELWATKGGRGRERERETSTVLLDFLQITRASH